MHIAPIPRQDLAQPRPRLPLADINFDFAAAHGEGWTLAGAAPVGAGLFGIQLQRLDRPGSTGPVFADDRDAWAHVVREARQGSTLHRQALRLIDDVERCLIEGLPGSW